LSEANDMAVMISRNNLAVPTYTPYEIAAHQLVTVDPPVARQRFAAHLGCLDHRKPVARVINSLLPCRYWTLSG
jgi:hypothetical protein